MKKILLFFTFVIITMTILLCYYGNERNIYNEEYYSISEDAGYVYDKKYERYLSFNIYSNTADSLIYYPEKNLYSLIFDYSEFTLRNVSVTKIDQGKNTVYTIDALLESYLIGLKTNNLFLKIKNSKFELKINVGAFSCISGNEYKSLGCSLLSPAYSYINSESMLVGINLRLENSYDILNSVIVGTNAYGIPSLIKNTLYDGDIEIKKVIPEYTSNLLDLSIGKINSSEIFIPICYKRKYLIRRNYIIVTLDNNKYLIDSILYSQIDPILSEFESLQNKGEVIYED